MHQGTNVPATTSSGSSRPLQVAVYMARHVHAGFERSKNQATRLETKQTLADDNRTARLKLEESGQIRRGDQAEKRRNIYSGGTRALRPKPSMWIKETNVTFEENDSRGEQVDK
ncbi:hypothetical protein MTO96_014432 [Rhipicephalus appendiculatus]